MRNWLGTALAVLAALSAGRAAAVELVVVAGPDPVDNCPVTLTLSPDEFWYPLAEGEWKLVDGGDEIPLQAIRRDIPEYTFTFTPDGSYVVPVSNHVWELHFVADGLDPFEKRVYSIEKGAAEAAHPVELARGEGKVDVKIGGEWFTSYLHAVTDRQPRPILYPVFGPDGVRMTRGFPMEPFEGEREDHPHHQSVWVSHGDVNGVNFWHLGEKQGYQHLKEFAALESGPVLGRIEALNEWKSETGEPVLEERRVIDVWGINGDERIVDFDITLVAAYGAVTFGDTKEGGLLSLRIASSMDENQRGDAPGGTIVNANGQVGESEAWGKASPWCDYSGPVGGITAGVTLMDHPRNPFYPTRYHVRGYGLFTANPFGLSHFVGRGADGARVLEAGDSWRIRYRLYIHRGDVMAPETANAYAEYADPPTAFLQ